MASRVTIGSVNLRDLTWIGANLREPDWRELSAQAPRGLTGSQIAAGIAEAIPPDWSWIASLDGQPVTAFGFQPYNAATWIGWAFGTRRMIRTIPAVTRHCWAQEQRLLDLGVRSVEVRTLTDHDISHAWLRQLGCTFRGFLPDAGINGETFELWSWSIGQGRPTQRTRYHVPTETQGSAEASAASDAADG